MAMYKPVYFSEKELASLTPSCSLKDIDEQFMKRLDFARTIAGIPFVLNCAYRSKEWDISKGRSGTSYHCKGRAVDIRCTTSTNRAAIVYSLLDAGFKSIGLYSSFIHVDDRYRDGIESAIIWFGDSFHD